MKQNRLWVAVGVVLGVLLMAGSATAGSTAVQEFVEVLKAEDLPDGGIVTSAQPLVYDHTFAPGNLATGTEVDVKKVKLAILLSECTNWVSCRYDLQSEGEWAVIEVNDIDDPIFDDSVRYFSLVIEDITMIAGISKVGDTIGISITSDGDESFAALFSVAHVYYSEVNPGTTGGGAAPMPEPSAALVFGMGLLVLSRRLRS